MITRGRRKQAARRAARALQDSAPKIACHCCGGLTITDRGRHEVCPVCFWEDDPDQTPEQDLGGANPLSLTEAKANYRNIGACEPAMVQYVRAPRPEEHSPEI